MTKAQEVFERVNTLVEGGTTKADAFRALAEELGKPEKSLQGAYYQHSRKTNGTSRSRVRETTTEGALASAVAALEKALESIDSEIEAAKERADEARAEYDALKSSAAERKQAIKIKIEALKA